MYRFVRKHDTLDALVGATTRQDNAGNASQDANGNDLVLKRAKAPNETVILLFQQFSRMINISSKGIAITE